MSIFLQNVFLKHERRVRLIFSNSLAAGAFSTLSFYTFAVINGRGTAPNPVAAYPVIGNLTSVELVLDNDLAPGGVYSISAIGVPALDASTTDGTNITQFSFPINFNVVPNVDTSTQDYGALLFGTDLVFNGTDFQVDQNGDLSTISGTPNAEGAITRRLLSNGLIWDPTYGAKARQYVDGVALGATSLRGALIQQSKADDRVKTATATLLSSDDPTNATFEVDVTLVGDLTVFPISVVVPSN